MGWEWMSARKAPGPPGAPSHEKRMRAGGKSAGCLLRCTHPKLAKANDVIGITSAHFKVDYLSSPKHPKYPAFTAEDSK